MPGVRVTPSLMLSGAGVTARGAVRSLRAMRADRRLAMLAAVGLFASLLAPWYREAVTVAGLAGSRTAAAPLSGWQALSIPAIVCAVAAIVVVVVLLARSGTVLAGLGARGRQAARTRADGGLVAACGAVSLIALLWTLAAPPGTAAGPGVLTASTSVRWGIVLALVCALALVALGALIAGARPRGARVPVRAGGPALATGAARTGEPPMPDFDFHVEPPGAVARAERDRGERRRPRPRADPIFRRRTP